MDSMYPDSGGGDMPDKSMPDETSTDKNREESGSQSALVPKALFDGKEIKVGSTVQFKIVHEYEDEVELEPVGEGGDDGNQDGMRESDGEEMKSAMSRMASFGGE